MASRCVQYTAGYSTIPEAVQEATARWVSLAYNLTLRDPALATQAVSGSLSQTWAADLRDHEPPPSLRALLAPYRRYTVGTDQG